MKWDEDEPARRELFAVWATVAGAVVVAVLLALFGGKL